MDSGISESQLRLLLELKLTKLSLKQLPSMQIPHRQLPTNTLKSVVLEFVTRDGTDHSSVDRRIDEVMKLLNDGFAELHFEDGKDGFHLKHHK